MFYVIKLNTEDLPIWIMVVDLIKLAFVPTTFKKEILGQ